MIDPVDVFVLVMVVLGFCLLAALLLGLYRDADA